MDFLPFKPKAIVLVTVAYSCQTMQYRAFKALKTSNFYQCRIFRFQIQTFGSVYSGL